MFKPVITYKPDINKTFNMMEKLYRDALNHQGGNVTFRALPPSDVDFYSLFDLTKYNYQDDLKQYAKDLSEKLHASFEARIEVDDNMLPTISPILGIGDYSAFVIGEITFQPDTSWSTPSLKDITDYKKFPPIGEAKWYKKFLEICEELLKISAPFGLPFMRGFFSPLDLAHALRGENIYYDFYDYPEELHQLLDYCADATIKFAEDIYHLANQYLKDTKYGMWFLKNTINMSEDIACMISGELYQEFCAPHTQKVIDHFGDGHMHTHSRSMYLVKEICSLNNVVNMWLPTDPNAPKPIEHAAQLAIDSRGTLLAIDCEKFEDIITHFDQMKKGNFSVTLPVKDIEEAIKLTEEFKKL